MFEYSREPLHVTVNQYNYTQYSIIYRNLSHGIVKCYGRNKIIIKIIIVKRVTAKTIKKNKGNVQE